MYFIFISFFFFVFFLILFGKVSAILFTPICPHSLSFRPLILPPSVTVKVEVPLDARNHAWAQFDGRDMKELKNGDCIEIVMAKYPLPSNIYY